MFEYKEDCKAYEKNVHHSKVMVIKNKDEEIGDGTAIYMGSHNMSGGAWGVLQRQGKTLYIGNYELGVFFKPRKGSKHIKQRIINSLLFKIDSEPYNLAVERPYLISNSL